MTVDEYVKELEVQLEADVIEKFKDWPVDTKLYMYLHHIQLRHMDEFSNALSIATQILCSLRKNNDA
jgi:hypothetical protein